MPKSLSAAFVALCLGGCAFDVIHVDRSPAQITSNPACGAPFTLTADVDVTPSGGYERTLKQHTTWRCVGDIAQGQVYRTSDQVLTIEASNVYEANIVVSDGQLTGFYLPVEQAFSALSPPATLPMAHASPTRQ